MLGMALLLVSGLKSQTKEEVYLYLDSIGVKESVIVLRQAVHETGWFKSYGCRKRKNLFGATNGRGTYLVFNTWQESCEWYLRWQNRHYKGQEYYSFLNCVFKRRNGDCVSYAEDPLYTNKLKKIKL